MIGKGMNMVICEHSHTVQFFPSHSKNKKSISHCFAGHCPTSEQDCSDEDKDCMNKIFYSLSQCEISPQINLEVSHAMMIVLMTRPQLWKELELKCEKVYLPIYPKPPRDYLSQLTILLI